MRELTIEGALFVLGLYLSLRVLAAFYGLLDLWYTIRTAYPAVIRGMVGWVGSTVTLAAWLDGPNRTAFACGLAAYLTFYLSLFGLRHLILRRPPQG